MEIKEELVNLTKRLVSYESITGNLKEIDNCFNSIFH